MSHKSRWLVANEWHLRLSSGRLYPHVCESIHAHGLLTWECLFWSINVSVDFKHISNPTFPKTGSENRRQCQKMASMLSSMVHPGQCQQHTQQPASMTVRRTILWYPLVLGWLSIILCSWSMWLREYEIGDICKLNVSTAYKRHISKELHVD